MHKITGYFVFLCVLCASVVNLRAQETQPAPGAPRSVKIPKVTEKKLPNGLNVVVVERRGAPLVSVRMLINQGITYEEISKSGLARTTMGLLTKGTATRNATKIANDIEFLGADISSSVGLDSATVSLDVTSDKIAQAMSIFADVIRRPSFPTSELDLARTQAIDELTYNLKQPSFLANYVATKYSFNGSPASGTIESLKAIKRKDLLDFYKSGFVPDGSTLVFVGNIMAAEAYSLARTHFGTWKNPPRPKGANIMSVMESAGSVEQRKAEDRAQPLVNRLLVIDLPNSGQAAVAFAKQLQHAGRIVWDDKNERGLTSKQYFPGIVMNSLLGGGYSSRLNQEIRIKRGLSYGAGSSITWRAYDARFSTRTQTKNESAPEVAELVVQELKRLSTTNAGPSDIAPRQAALIGDFSRGLETNSGMIGGIADLYDNWLSPKELDQYLSNVQTVSAANIREFAAQHLNGGDIIIVGDYSIFKDDLAKRFPGLKIDVIKADELDLSKENLRK